MTRITSEQVRGYGCVCQIYESCIWCRIADQLDADAALLAEKDASITRVRVLAAEWRATGKLMQQYHYLTMGFGYSVCADALEAALKEQP